MPSVSHSCADRAWILSLAFCRHSAAFSVNSAGVCSLIMNISLTGGCPAAGLSSLLLSLPLGWTARGISTVSPSHPPPPHSPPLPGTPPPRVLIRLCHSAGSLTRSSLRPLSAAKRPAKVSQVTILLSHRAVDARTSFSNPSSPSSRTPLASPAPGDARPAPAPRLPALPPRTRALPPTGVRPAGVWGRPCTHMEVQGI